MTSPTASDERRPKASFLVRNRTRLGRLLFAALLPVMLFARSGCSDIVYVNFILQASGFVLICSGVMIRLWSTLYIGGRKDSVLQRTGPYSVVRHPLYLGSLLIGIGVSVFAGNLVLLALVLLYFFWQYRTTIGHEENVLAELFGEDYAMYKRTTPCFTPMLSNYDPGTLESINPKPLYREVIRAAMALGMVPLLQLISLLQEAKVLPILLRLP